MIKRASPFLWVLVAVLLSRLLTMIALPLADTSEPRYAEIARLMAVTGDWITPWFEPGVPFWGKPPLSFWLQAISFRLWGVNDFAARFPAWLATLAMLGLSARYAALIGGRSLALWSSLILSSMALVFISAGAVLTDPFLALGTTLSLISVGMVLEGKVRLWRWLFFVGLVIGLLAKGPLAVVLVGVPVCLWMLWSNNRRSLLMQLPWIRGTLITLALVLPWYIAAEIKTPGFLDYFIIGEHFKRFIDPGWAGDLYGTAHVQPRGMIWVFWTWATFPWGILALFGLGWALFSKTSRRRMVLSLRDDRQRLILLSALAPGLFFTFAGNILWTYLLPALPFTALLIAKGGASLKIAWPRYRFLMTPAVLLVPLAGTIMGFYMTFHPELLKTEVNLVGYYDKVARPSDGQLRYLDEIPFSARYYSRGAVGKVDRESLAGLLEASNRDRLFIAVRRKDQEEMTRLLKTPAEIVFDNRRYVLLEIELPGAIDQKEEVAKANGVFN